MARDTEHGRNSADHPSSGTGVPSTAEQARQAYAVALEHFGNGRLAEAGAACHKALSRQPEHFEALHLQGVIHAQRGALDDAAQSIRRALKLNPDSADAHNSLGIVLGRQGKPKQALGCYDVAISIRPSYVEALNNRGAALRRLKRFDEAIASQGNAASLEGLGRSLMAAGRIKEAVRVFQRAARSAPSPRRYIEGWARPSRRPAGPTRQ